MALPTLRSCSCWLYSGQCCPLFPNQPSSPNHLRCDSRFRFSSQTLFSFCDWMPKPTLSGKGIFFSLSPDKVPPPQLGGDAWGPRECGSCQPDSRLVQPRWEPEAYCSQHPLFPSLSWKQKGSGDRGPSLLSRAACLWAPQTHSFPIPSLRRSLPALPHHPTNGPQSPADQSCTTVETRSALQMPLPLSHS